MSHREVDALHREHEHIVELVDVLARQFDSLDRGGIPDWQILADLLDYLVEHPESDHTRFEARLLQRLAQRAPSCEPLAAALLARHHELMTEGRQLRRLVQGILNGQVVPRSRLVQLGQDFVRDYRELIERENEELFPSLAHNLRASDWLELVTDRYWGKTVGDRTPESGYESEYEMLCRCIQRQAGGQWPRATTPTRCPICDDRYSSASSAELLHQG